VFVLLPFIAFYCYYDSLIDNCTVFDNLSYLTTQNMQRQCICFTVFVLAVVSFRLELEFYMVGPGVELTITSLQITIEI